MKNVLKYVVLICIFSLQAKHLGLKHPVLTNNKTPSHQSFILLSHSDRPDPQEGIAVYRGKVLDFSSPNWQVFQVTCVEIHLTVHLVNNRDRETAAASSALTTYSKMT